MGIIYTVTPVNEAITNQELFDWLYRWEVSLSDEFIPGRYPTFGEVKEILDSLQDCTVEFHGINGFPIQVANISTEYDHTEFSFRQSNRKEIEHLSFSRGGDIVIQIMQHFANICGTFLLTYDGEDPFFVFPAQSE